MQAQPAGKFVTIDPAGLESRGGLAHISIPLIALWLSASPSDP